MRTRSKFPLQDTSLETLERSFIPPDISADMYESGLEEEDEEWKNFLREYALTSCKTSVFVEDARDASKLMDCVFYNCHTDRQGFHWVSCAIHLVFY